MPQIRPAHPSDHSLLARLWHDGWQEAHAAHVPARLTRLRTLDSFEPRIAKMGDDLRVAGPIGAPIGLCAIKGDELYQLYVGKTARGTGLARRLLADGEARLAAKGIERAVLLCAPGNDRAAAFYMKNGWTLVGLRPDAVDTQDGPFTFDLLRFEKFLCT